MIHKTFFHRIILILTILGILLECLGFFMKSLNSTFSPITILLGYILIIFGLLSLALQNLISKLKGEFSYKEVCLSSMFSALGFYLLTPITSLIFRGPGLSLLFLIPAFFSLISALFSVIMGVLFLRKRF